MKLTLGAAFIYPLLVSMGCSTNGGGGEGPPPGSGTNGGAGSTDTSTNGGQGLYNFHTGGSQTSGTVLPSLDSGCAADEQLPERTRVNILFLLDKSGSMGDTPTAGNNATERWNPVVTTLDSFFSDQKSTGIYASLSFLPADGYIGVACKAASYSAGNASIKVPLTLLDDAGRAKFLERLCDPANATASTCIQPAGGTPTRPALQGTIDYLLRTQQASPTNSKTVIVFLTDGEPGFGYTYNGTTLGMVSCDDLPKLKSDNNTPDCALGSCNATGTGPGCADDSSLCTDPAVEVQKVANVIKTAPPKSVYVFGVGDLTQGTMDAWASASGNPAVPLQGMSGAQAAATLKAALESLRTTTFDCNIKIPAPKVGTAIDYVGKVNVNYIDGKGVVTALGQSQGCTSGQPSWQYDDVGNPTYIKLCGNACDMAQKDLQGKTQVVFGCATLIF